MHEHPRIHPAVLLIVLSTLMSGCASRSQKWTGPVQPERVLANAWSQRSAPATVLNSPRYTIYTTLPSGARRDALPQVLEGAYAQYQAIAPAKVIDARPMHCFVFAGRKEWEEFTSRRTGDDAPMYLQIPRGGYTIDDWFVAYSDSDRGVFSAAAHEGWHQYVARHFKGRMPPFLEEGMACLFEDVRMSRGLPRWNTSVNAARLSALTTAAKETDLWPLEELIGLHAGHVVKEPREKINAFYAQSWAFARFLNEADGGWYRPMFRKLLADAAAGEVHRTYDAEGTRALLERYLHEDLGETERSFAAFVRQITGVDPAAP
jgi:hypothetical protein